MNLKILTQKEFEAEIKQLQRDKFPITMIDAILEYCTIKNVEDASDLPTIHAISKIVKKQYISYPKSLYL